MTDNWWWDSTDWKDYLTANNEPWRTNISPAGNLVVTLDDGIWSRIRKGHRAAIRSAEKSLTVAESFEGYRKVHRLANGDVRPERTFDLMRGWPNGLALVAVYRGILAAAAFFVWQGAGSYYFSGPRNPHIDAPGAAHLIIWTAMTQLRDSGVRWLDMGAVPSDGDPKHESIAGFKRHFGAQLKVWPNYD